MIYYCARWYLFHCAWLGAPIAIVVLLIPRIGRWLKRH